MTYSIHLLFIFCIISVVADKSYAWAGSGGGGGRGGGAHKQRIHPPNQSHNALATSLSPGYTFKHGASA